MYCEFWDSFDKHPNRSGAKRSYDIRSQKGMIRKWNICSEIPQKLLLSYSYCVIFTLRLFTLNSYKNNSHTSCYYLVFLNRGTLVD